MILPTTKAITEFYIKSNEFDFLPLDYISSEPIYDIYKNIFILTFVIIHSYYIEKITLFSAQTCRLTPDDSRASL